MQPLLVTLIWEELPTPPTEGQARYARILAILRRYRCFLTPTPEPPTLVELPIPAKEAHHD
jgi:hypothetical protein